MDHREFKRSLKYSEWVQWLHNNATRDRPVDCDCEGCYWMDTKGDYILMEVVSGPDHIYEREKRKVIKHWYSMCPKRKHLNNSNHRKPGNGKPKGIWAGTFTVAPTDPYNEDDMIRAVRKLFSQSTSPVKKYSWYLEYTENGLPHIHFCYATPDGGRILRKVFARVWPIWNEDISVGRGHRGGYHNICSSPDDYLKYISKDKGRHDTNWPEDD